MNTELSDVLTVLRPELQPKGFRRRAPEPGKDRRQHRRYDLPRLDCRIGGRPGTVLDVSLVGLAVETEEPLRIGDRYPLRIELPEGSLELTVDVARSRLVEVRKQGLDKPPVYQAGLDFRHEIDDRAPELLAFIQDHVLLEDPSVRGFLRIEQRGGLGRVESCSVLLFGARRALVTTSWSGTEGDEVGLTLQRDEESLSATARVVEAVRTPSGETEVDLALEPLDCTAHLTLRRWVRDRLE